MKILNLLLPMMTLLAMLFGCGGESKVTSKGWKKAKPLAENLDHPNALAADGKFIYFITGGTVASQKDGTNNVLKLPVEGSAPVVLFKGGDIIPDANAVALDDAYVYFSADGLRRVPKAGGEATLLTKAFIAWEIAVDNENVYWMPYVGERMPPAPIYTVSKTGGEPKALTDPRPSANGLCIDEKNVYWIQTDGIYRTDKKGGTIEKVYAMPAGGEIAGELQSDADSFYFMQVRSSILMKVAKTGGEAKLLAKDIDKFRVGDSDLIIQRRLGSLNTAIFRIGKNGEGETELDAGGFLYDLITVKDKVYLCDIASILEVSK